MSVLTALGYGLLGFFAAFVVGLVAREVLGLSESARLAFLRAVGIGVGTFIGYYLA